MRSVTGQDAQAHVAEAHTLKPDIAKATHELQWQQHLPIDAALDWVATWVRAFHAGQDSRALCDEQIRRYVNERVTSLRTSQFRVF